MHEIMTTIVGNLVGKPVVTEVSGGRKVANFRMACTETTYNSEIRRYVDGQTSFFSVSAWGPLGENAALSFDKGERVLVHGKLSVGTYLNKEGEPRTRVQVEARALGHDLTFGFSRYGRFVRPNSPAAGADSGDSETARDMVATALGGREVPEDENGHSFSDDTSTEAGDGSVGEYQEIDGIFVDRDGQVMPAGAR